MLRRRGIRIVIPEPSDQRANRQRRGQMGGRPPKLDRETYKRRNTVERSFNLLKQWRGLATRYDKHAIVYRAGAVLAAIITWLRSELMGGRPHTTVGRWPITSGEVSACRAFWEAPDDDFAYSRCSGPVSDDRRRRETDRARIRRPVPHRTRSLPVVVRG